MSKSQHFSRYIRNVPDNPFSPYKRRCKCCMEYREMRGSKVIAGHFVCGQCVPKLV